MSEIPGGDEERAAEFARENALKKVIEEYFPEDQEYFAGYEFFDDRLGAVYGQLLEYGESAERILGEAGILEEEKGDEV